MQDNVCCAVSPLFREPLGASSDPAGSESLPALLHHCITKAKGVAANNNNNTTSGRRTGSSDDWRKDTKDLKICRVVYYGAFSLPPCQVRVPLRPSSNLRHPMREKISTSTERGKSKTRRTPISIWPPSCIAGSLRRTRQAFWPVQTPRAQIMGLYANPPSHWTRLNWPPLKKKQQNPQKNSTSALPDPYIKLIHFL